VSAPYGSKYVNALVVDLGERAMSLVTAQGRQARQYLDEEIVRVSELVAAGIDDEPKVLEALDRFRSTADEAIVREAIWRLIDSQQVQLTSDRRLRRVGA